MLTNAQEQERNVVACDLFLWFLKFFQIEEQQNRENDKTFLEFLHIVKIQLLQLKQKEGLGQTRTVKGSSIRFAETTKILTCGDMQSAGNTIYGRKHDVKVNYSTSRQSEVNMSANGCDEVNLNTKIRTKFAD